jgi:hypothetical protein
MQGWRWERKSVRVVQTDETGFQPGQRYWRDQGEDRYHDFKFGGFCG